MHADRHTVLYSKSVAQGVDVEFACGVRDLGRE